MLRDRLSRIFGRKVEPTPEAPAEPVKAVRPEDYVGDDPERNEQAVREGFVEKARRYLSSLPMAGDVVAAYFCMLDPNTPKWVKGVAAAALAYFILPIDAIPDILPIFGLSDDAAVLTAALTAITAYITNEHREKARRWMASEQIDAPPPSPATGADPG